MKKTEKIEARLSHEEKTALTELAEQESRSVSDLVRGLIERYMSINTTRLPQKTPWAKFVAIAVGGFFAGHLATYFIASDVPESLQTATIKLCRETEADCQAIANPILKFNPNQHSALSFKDTNGQEFYVRLAPTIPARK